MQMCYKLIFYGIIILKGWHTLSHLPARDPITEKCIEEESIMDTIDDVLITTALVAETVVIVASAAMFVKLVFGLLRD